MKKLVILGHQNPDVDSVVSGYILEKILRKKGYNAEFIIPDEELDDETLDICLRNEFDPSVFQKKIDYDDAEYILVDHNERDVDGKIVCIIDHHPTRRIIKLGNYYNTKVSSTACFIARNNVELLDREDIKLVILATLVDTASFHSTKGREEDKKWILDLCNRYDFDYDLLYKEGLCLTPLNNINKVSLNGLKKYKFDSKRVESSYVQISLNDIDIVDKVIDNLSLRVKNNKLNSFIFIVHDMDNFKTKRYLINDGGVTVKEYNTYTSRGEVIMPEIENLLKKDDLVC